MTFENMTPLAVAEELGRRLKQARLRADLTQAEVALKAGVRRRVILNAEKGKVQLENLIAILQAIGMVEKLNLFLPVQEISPIQLAKLKGRQRKRASGARKRKTQKTKDKTLW